MERSIFLRRATMDISISSSSSTMSSNVYEAGERRNRSGILLGTLRSTPANAKVTTSLCAALPVGRLFKMFQKRLKDAKQK